MAILTKKAGLPITPPGTETVADQKGEKTDTSTSDGRFLALKDGDHRYSDLELAEARTLEHLRSSKSFASVQAISPELAKKAIDSACAYVTDRSDPRGWAELVLCDPQTIVDSVRDLVAIGLVPNSVRGTAFLAPFLGDDGRRVCSPIPGVRGYEERVCSNPLIATVTYNAVREHDIFEAEEGVNPKLVFKRKLGVDPKANRIVGAYALITAKDERVHISTINISETVIKEPKRGGGEYAKTVYLRQDGGVMNTRRMSADIAAAYVPLRKALREVGRTWLCNDERVQAMLQMEDTAFKQGAELTDEHRLSLPEKASTAAIIEEAKVPKVGQQAILTETQDKITKSVSV